MSKKRTTKKPKPCYVWVPMEPDGTLWPVWAEDTRKACRASIRDNTDGIGLVPVRCEVRPVKKGKR